MRSSICDLSSVFSLSGPNFSTQNDAMADPTMRNTTALTRSLAGAQGGLASVIEAHSNPNLAGRAPVLSPFQPLAQVAAAGYAVAS